MHATFRTSVPVPLPKIPGNLYPSTPSPFVCPLAFFKIQTFCLVSQNEICLLRLFFFRILLQIVLLLEGVPPGARRFGDIMKFHSFFSHSSIDCDGSQKISVNITKYYIIFILKHDIFFEINNIQQVKKAFELYHSSFLTIN